MARILILGAGTFGLKAARVLSQKKHNRITVVEADPQRCGAAAAEGPDAVNGDAIACLTARLKSPAPPD